MSRRHLVPLALAITALLAIVAVAARGRPLGSRGGAGSGLPAAFWDYVFTSVLILVVFMALAALVALFLLRREHEHRPGQTRTLRALAILLAVAALLTFVGRHIDLQRLLHPNGSTTTTPTAPASTIPGANGKHQRSAAPRHLRFQWEELVVVLGLLVALAAAAALTRSRLGPGTRRVVASEALAAALDDSLDDLRTDADLRRAIVAAYARMESALAAVGIPRRPAEAPLEYLERALLALDTSAGSVRRLTDLFEWARFSQYEPEPPMRDEAVDALVAVRAELRASAGPRASEPVAR